MPKIAVIDDDVVACVTLRERYLSRLHDLLGPSSVPSDLGDIPLEVGDLLLLLRQATIDVTEAVARWRQDNFGGSIRPFEWEGSNYLLKICSDLDFLDDSPVRHWVGFTLRRNPFVLPESLDDIVEPVQKQARDRIAAEIEGLQHKDVEDNAAGEGSGDTVELGSGVETLVGENFDAERNMLHSAAKLFSTLKELPELKPLEILFLSAAALPQPHPGLQPTSTEAWPSAAPSSGPPPSSLVKGLARVWRTPAKDGDEQCLRLRAAIRSLLQEEACGGRLALNPVATSTAARELRDRQDGLGRKPGALAQSIDPVRLVGSDNDSDGYMSSGEFGSEGAGGDDTRVGASTSSADGEPQSSERAEIAMGARAPNQAVLPRTNKDYRGLDQDRWRRLAHSTQVTATYATRVLRRKSSLARLLARTLTLCNELWWLRCSFEGRASNSRSCVSGDIEHIACIRDPAKEAARAIREDAFAMRRARAAIGSCTRRLAASRALLERRRARLGQCCEAMKRRAEAHVALVQSLESSGAARRAISMEQSDWERNTLERTRLERKQHRDKLQRSNERWAAQRRDEFLTWREQQKLRLEVAMLWQLQLQPHEKHRCAHHFATVARNTFEHVAEGLAYEKSLREQEDRRRQRRLRGSAYGQQAEVETVVLDSEAQPQQHNVPLDRHAEAEVDKGSASTQSRALEKAQENTEASANANAKAEEMEQLLEVSRHVRSRLDTFDESGDGTVERVGFYRTMKDLGVTLSTVQLAAAFAVLDPDDTNAVDTRVFCAALRQAGRRLTCEADDKEDNDASATQTKEYNALEKKREASLLRLRERKHAEAEMKARLAAERDSAADTAVRQRKARAEARAQQDLLSRQKARAARARREKQPIYKRILRVGGELQVLRVLTRPRIGYEPAGWSVQLYLPETSRLLQAEVDAAGLANKGFDKPAEQVAMWAPLVKFTFIDRVGRLRVPRELTIRGNSTLDLAPDQLVMEWTGDFVPLTVKEAAKAAARAALAGALAARMRSARAEALVQQVVLLAAQAVAQAARTGLAAAVAAGDASAAAEAAIAKLAVCTAHVIALQASDAAAQAAVTAEAAAISASTVVISLATEGAIAVARAAASAAKDAAAVASAAAVGSETIALELGLPLPAVNVVNSTTKSGEAALSTETKTVMAPNRPIVPSPTVPSKYNLVSSGDEQHTPKFCTPSRGRAADDAEVILHGTEAAVNTSQRGESSAELFSQMEANLAQELDRRDDSTTESRDAEAESALGNRDHATIRPVSLPVQTLPSSPIQLGVKESNVPVLELETGGIASAVNGLASSDDKLPKPKSSTTSRESTVDEAEIATLGTKAAVNTLQQGETSAELFSQVEANVAQKLGPSEGASIVAADAAPACGAMQAIVGAAQTPATSQVRAAVLVQAVARGMLAREKFGTG